MANRVQTLRSATGGARPAAGTRMAGELYVNWPDKQIGVIDSSQNPLDLVGVRFFSTGASYNVGDYTIQGGELYRATAAITPGAFSAAQWDQVMTVANAAGTYLPLTGGTLAGPGNLTVNGTATFGSTMTVANTIVASNSIGTKGTLGALWAYDRGNGGGTTTQIFGLYRDANVGRLYMDPAGDVMTMSTAGAATFAHVLTCSAGLSVTGSVNVSGAISLGGTASFPLQITTPAGVYPAILTQCAGQHAWYAGAWTDGGYYLFDATAGATRFLIDNAGNTALHGPTSLDNNLSIASGASSPLSMSCNSNQNCITYATVNSVRAWYWGVMTDGTYRIADSSGGRLCFEADTSGNIWVAQNGGELIAGPNGAWSSGAIVCGCISGLYGCTTYGGGGAGGWAYMSRVDNWQTYCHLTYYSSTVTGSITSNGTNTFFNTTCDGRRKDNARELSSEIDVGHLIDELKPVAFEWKRVEATSLDGKDISVEAHTDHGFIAQDLYKVVPHIVHVPEDDSEMPWMADYSKLVPYLVAELQTLRRRIAKLEGRPS